MTILFRCIDIETTGIDPTVHRVCEVATVDILVSYTSDKIVDEGDTYKLLPPDIKRGSMWSSLVNPERDIPPEASAVHNITDEVVKDAPKIEDLLATITEGSPDYYCAHNSRFDQKFLNPKDSVWLDTYRIALWLWPGAPEHKLATLRYWLKLNLSMTDVVLAQNMMATTREETRTRSHSALWDAYVCAAVLRRAFMAGATIEQMVKVSSQPALLPRFTFGKWAMRPVEEVDDGYLDWILRQDGMDDDVKHTAFAELQRRRNLEKMGVSP